jgi:hypothetical protein
VGRFFGIKPLTRNHVGMLAHGRSTNQSYIFIFWKKNQNFCGYLLIDLFIYLFIDKRKFCGFDLICGKTKNGKNKHSKHNKK